MADEYTPTTEQRDPMNAETCRACDAIATGATTLDVTPDDNLPLCTRHWNWWLEQYTWLHPMDEKPTPPCAAHLITAPKEDER